MTRPLLLCALLALCACLPDPFRGSQVVLELGTANPADLTNRPTQHYELFALLNGGLVPIGAFVVDEALVARAFTGLPLDQEEKLGVANRPSPDGLPQSGIELVTEANLADAQEILLTLEDNGDTDPTPARVVARATLAPNRRSVLFGDLQGEVPILGGRTVPLVQSRVAVVLGEHEVD
jgi:hypothetical protein